MSDFPALDITPFWATVNDDLITIVDSIPDDKLNWTPKPDLWNFRGILLHIAAARDGWLGGAVRDGETPASVCQTTRTKGGDPRGQSTARGERAARFVSDAEKLDATYETSWADNPLAGAGNRPLDRVPPAGARHPPPLRPAALPRAPRRADARCRPAVAPRPCSRPQWSIRTCRRRLRADSIGATEPWPRRVPG